MKKMLVCMLLCVITTLSWAEDRDKVLDRVTEAGNVMNEIMAAPDKGIPEDILGSAECVAVVPSMLKGGFIVGAAYGKGVASCKTPRGWSAPAFFRVEGGSFGFQIGGQAVDLVMVIMNERGMRALLSSKFKLGADASAAAGPLGRTASAETDATLRADILSYSRARGAFAGVSLEGSTLRPDNDANKNLYGKKIEAKEIVLDGAVKPPASASTLLETLDKASPVNKSK